MGFSFGMNRRRQANAEQPGVRVMRAIAAEYGPNSGTAEDLQLFEYLFKRYFRLIGVRVPTDAHTAGPLVAREAAGSEFPLAVHAAWCAARTLPVSDVNALSKALGSRGAATAATFLTDEFPGLAKLPVLGEKTSLWRAPAAVCAVMLSAHADANGLMY